MAGGVLIRLGPEKGEQGVASQVAIWSGEGQVREQRQALGLGEDRPDLLTGGVPEIDPTEHPEPSQRRLLRQG